LSSLNKGMSHQERWKFWDAQDWTLRDSDLAKKLGCVHGTVNRARMMLGKPKAQKHGSHFTGKLPEQTVAEIRKMRQAGHTLADIGQRFNISKQRVDQILNPEKAKARVAVAECLRRGWLIRPEVCQSCGDPGEIEAHHDDYSKPLEVRWLCKSCHNLTRVGEPRTGMTRSEQEEFAERNPGFLDALADTLRSNQKAA
jgi:hypothetical protein